MSKALTPAEQADKALAAIEQARSDGKTIGKPFDDQITDVKWQRAAAQVANQVTIGEQVKALGALIGLTGSKLTGNAVFDAVSKASDVDGASVIARGVSRAKAVFGSNATATRGLQMATLHTPERFTTFRENDKHTPNATIYLTYLLAAFGPKAGRVREVKGYTITGDGAATTIVAAPRTPAPNVETPASGKVSSDIGIGDVLTGDRAMWETLLTSGGDADIVSGIPAERVLSMTRLFVARALLIAAESAPAAPADPMAALAALTA